MGHYRACYEARSTTSSRIQVLWRHEGCARPWRGHRLQWIAWQLGLRKSSGGVRKRCEPLDLADPVSEVDDAGEDAGVDGVPAVQTPAGQSLWNPGMKKSQTRGSPESP